MMLFDNSCRFKPFASIVWLLIYPIQVLNLASIPMASANTKTLTRQPNITCSSDRKNKKATDTVALFVLAGQSNMVGYRSNLQEIPPKLQKTQHNVLWYNDRDRWEPLQVPTEPLPFSEWLPNEVGFGPEISLGKQLANCLGDTVALVKYSRNATSLAEDWNPALADSLYYRMLARTSKAITDLEARGKTVRIAGFFWMQGEADASNKEFAENYRENLSYFIQTVRRDFKQPKLPFVYGMVHFGNQHTKPNGKTNCCGDIVRQAQKQVNESIAATAIVETNDLPLHADKIHFNSQGLIVLGNRMAMSWVEIRSASTISQFFLQIWHRFWPKQLQEKQQQRQGFSDRTN